MLLLQRYPPHVDSNDLGLLFAIGNVVCGHKPILSNSRTLGFELLLSLLLGFEDSDEKSYSVQDVDKQLTSLEVMAWINRPIEAPLARKRACFAAECECRDLTSDDCRELGFNEKSSVFRQGNPFGLTEGKF